MSPLYMLKLNKSSDRSKPQISYYGQGISAQCISLKNVIHWTICRIEFPHGTPESKSLNRPFLAFQRKIRQYLGLLRKLRNIRLLLGRELSGNKIRLRASL